MAIIATLENYKENNELRIQRLHPEVRKIFAKFLLDCESFGIPLYIYSDLRSIEKQAELKARFDAGLTEIKAATPGYSYHNYGLAIDVYVYNESLQRFDRANSLAIYKQIAPIATRNGLRWLGSKSTTERHHFDYNQFRTSELLRAVNQGKVDIQGYVIFSEIQKRELKLLKDRVLENWNTEIGESVIQNPIEQYELEPPKVIRKVSKIEKSNAVGIWQIIKLVADQYSLSQSVNDASIATSQGSLLNYVNTVVQKPWLEFFGDTVGDQYYFFTRKEPFDYFGWTKLPMIYTVEDDDVLSDDLSWYDGEIFSWYQIVPRGSFLGEQNLIFAYISAVFFEEYAEIWGSKPNIQVSNYVNFTKIKGRANMYDKAIEDLRYMVESNAYLPFTRQGTITIRGNSKIKRGYKIFYQPTGEEYYVESVSNRYSVYDGGTDFVTILQVTRGMKTENTAAPTDKSSKSYFNLILFDKPSEQEVEVEKEVPENSAATFYFDNNRSHLIDLNENFEIGNDTISMKMNTLINEFPDVRPTLDNINRNLSIKAAIRLIKDNPEAEEFVCKGFIDSDDYIGGKQLARNRAITTKGFIIEEYLKRHNDRTKTDLERLIKIEFDTSGSFFNPLDENGEILNSESVINSDNEINSKTKAYERICSFIMKAYVKKEKERIAVKDVNWKVNDEVFHYFLNRKQFANG